MQEHAKKYITPEEYLAMEEKAEYKSEYFQGEIFALAGGTASHSQIAVNLIVTLAPKLQAKKCRLFSSDMKVWITEKELFTYPDITIICDKPEFYPGRKDAITNPLLIIEVLSDSTKSYDRVEKFEYYRSIPTFQEYILVDQYKVHIEHFYYESKGRWIFTEYKSIDDILNFTKINFKISLKEIYNQIEFEEDKNSEKKA